MRLHELARHALGALAVVAAVVAGYALARVAASELVAGVTHGLVGQAWVTTGEKARAALGTMLGVQLTLMGLVLSFTTAALASVVSEQSPRLTAVLTPRAPLAHASLAFLLSATFALTAMRQLGAPLAEAPRPVLTVALLLVLAAVGIVLGDAAHALRAQRVSHIIQKASAATHRSILRLAAHSRRLELAPDPVQLEPPASPIRAAATGYVVAIDAASLVRDAQRRDLVVRLDTTIGAHVVVGEPIGWATGSSEGLARAVEIAPARELALDVGLGLRMLVDIADRALSPGINDPYTACEVLHAVGALLVELQRVPDGDWHVRDDQGRVRASLAFPSFPERLSLVVDGPLRYGAADPDVLDAVLDVARVVGTAAAPGSVGRGAARRLTARVVEDAESGGMEAGRLGLLREKARAVLRAIDVGGDADERVRAAWALGAPA